MFTKAAMTTTDQALNSQQLVMDFIHENPHYFRKPADWFTKNWSIVKAFEAQALVQLAAGAKHCSAREVIYFLSMHTGEQEVAGQYKIGNDNGADLVRVFCILHPQHVDLWEQRRSDTHYFKIEVNWFFQSLVAA